MDLSRCQKAAAFSWANFLKNRQFFVQDTA
jgi:hypothetical protein